MKQLRAWGLYGLLLALALAAGLASTEPPDDDVRPSITNGSPRGLAVLATWLRESGVAVEASTAPFTTIPAGARTIVIAAPAASTLDTAEARALEAWVEEGGTLIVLPSRNAPQPALRHWLGLSAGDVAPLVDEEHVKDVGGTSAKVKLQAGLTAGVRALRLSAEGMFDVRLGDSVPVAEYGALWFTPLGRGEVWVGPPELAENARLELLDNARFWANVGARGPIVFDEFHHQLLEKPAAPVNLTLATAQLVLCALVFVAARGSRLGPPREEAARRHRSALEYVRAMAALTRNAGVEGELVEALRRELRLTLHEKLGTKLELPWEEVAREVERHAGVPASEVLAASTDGDFVSLSKRVAELERKLG